MTTSAAQRYAAAMVRHRFVTLALAATPWLLSCSEAGPGLPSTCNGHEALCDRRYDQVAFAATHNAMADTDSGIFGPCQTHPIARQLEDGIRGLMIDTYYDPDDGVTTQTCHGVCLDENRTLETDLRTIATFLRTHRDAVVTIIFESYISAAATEAAFEASGALRYTYAHTLGEPWPTLREMIANDERLVVFTDTGGGTETGPHPWYMDQWQYAFQNPYAANTADDFSCITDRGTDGAGQIFIMNHFLTNPIASFDLAAMVNPYAVLKPHVDDCVVEQGRIPNFVTVDFYDTGDLMQVVDELNGFGATP